MLKQIISATKTVLLAIVLSFGLSYAIAAWNPPTQLPPGGNADTPINTGSTLQIKDGADICTTVGVTTKCIQDIGSGSGDDLGNHTATQALDMVGFNVNNAANLLNTSATAQTKSGGLTVGSLTTGGAVRSSSVYSNILKLGTPGGDSGQSPDYYGIYQESGPWSGAFPDLKIGFHTGIKYDAYYGYGGHRFYSGYDGTGNPSGLVMGVGNGDMDVRVTNGLYANDVYSAVAGKWMSSMHGPKSFSASGSFTVPIGVNTIYISGRTASGGGASGAGCSAGADGGNGGGAASVIPKLAYSVTPGQVLAITIGQGGIGGAVGGVSTNNNPGGAGGTTTVSGLATFPGAAGGIGGTGVARSSGTSGSGYLGGAGGTYWYNGNPGGNGTILGGGGGGGGSACVFPYGAGGAGGNGVPAQIILDW